MALKAGSGAALSGTIVGAVSIEAMLVAARTFTAAYRGFRMVESGWWDDVFGETSNQIKPEIKVLEGELEFCEWEKENRDSDCAKKARALKDKDAQPWHVQQQMRQCIERSQLKFETCAKPLWQRLRELRRSLSNLP